MNKLIIFFGLMAFTLGLSAPANAELIDRGNGLIYDDVLNITWMQNANLARTLGYKTLYQRGSMTWYQALEFIDYLNRIEYLGYDDWRLPKTRPLRPPNFNYQFSYSSSTDYGFNKYIPKIKNRNSEMAYMYYVNLGNLARYKRMRYRINPDSGLRNTGPFKNMRNGGPSGQAFWSMTESWNSLAAWECSFINGNQLTASKNRAYNYVWVVRDGDVAPDNEPPIANAGPDQVVELESPEGALVTLDGSASTDPDSTPETNDDIELFEWYEEGTLIGTGETLDHTFSLAEHHVILKVINYEGETDEDEVIITLRDTTPPDFTIATSPVILWSANNKMRDVEIQGEATDLSGEVYLQFFVEDEYEESKVVLSDFNEIIQLKASRKGNDIDGKLYTIEVIATDRSGNTASATTNVVVYHDMRKK